ncbi:MAG: prolyl oligopeptidase family serine peptidase, partial [Emcibacteraceae bacterium]|nr:prolyl oligopeptidase family serine peptidase [Emcibacteraceae bacterium]
KCSIAHAPITDLITYRTDRRNYTNYRSIMNYIESDNYSLTDASPADNIDKINIPVLIFHSENDTRVNVRHSNGFNSKMKAAGKDITYIHWEEGNNFLSLQPQRIDFLANVGKFLNKHLEE